MNMREQNFGIEIEMTGITREKAAKSIAEYFGTESYHYGGGYREYRVPDLQGREWKLVYDGSIITVCRGNDEDRGDYSTELVSPICRYQDIKSIQEIIRRLKQSGAVTNNSCGIHIHINAQPHNALTLRNITNIMASKEDLIYKALNVNVERRYQYCQPVNMRFLEEINYKKPKDLDSVKEIWYDGRDRSHRHYDDSRYHCLNLHSVFQKGTIEFRLFNATTHAGKIKAYIQLCLAISNQALAQKCASRRKTVTTNEKYTFRTWLLRLGLIGDEFKTARQHLLSNLEGSIAWKDPAQAERQKERLQAKRNEAVQTQYEELISDRETDINMHM